MVPALLMLLMADSLPTYADAATAAFVARARERHAAPSAVHDYRARVTYRFTYGLGKRRWAAAPTATAEEQEAEIRWQRENDLRVDIIGKRVQTRLHTVPGTSLLTEPWFVPGPQGDSLRVFFSGFPERAALHPLAAGAERWYRYRLADSVRITTPAGVRTIVLVEVTPARPAPALVAGRLWLDGESAALVRMTIRFVGTAFWAMPNGRLGRSATEARLTNAVLNRTTSLDADLEYALLEGGHWLPFRQVVSGRIEVPLIGEVVVPFEVTTTFRDFQVNTGEPIVFDVPLPDSVAEQEAHGRMLDSLRGAPPDARGRRQYAGRWAGGRWQIRRVAVSELWNYPGWEAPLALERAPGDDRRLQDGQAAVAQLLGRLPSEVSGRPADQTPLVTAANAFRYNRVQGVTLGGAVRTELPIPFVEAELAVRYGLGDQRVVGRGTITRDAPGGRWTVAGYRDLAVLDPFSNGLSLGNSVRSLFLARDEADWHLAEGGAVRWETSVRRGVELALEGRWERHRSVATAAAPVFGQQGGFPANPPVTEARFGVLGARLEGGLSDGRWSVAGDALVGAGQLTARLWGEGQVGLRALGLRRGILRAKAGLASSDTLPQAQFRAGGLNTVRGFAYGEQRGPAMWALQADLALGDRFLWQPVLFADAGQAGAPGDLVGGTPMLAGAGAGISLFGGLLRFDVSHPLTRRSALRFDISLVAVR